MSQARVVTVVAVALGLAGPALALGASPHEWTLEVVGQHLDRAGDGNVEKVGLTEEFQDLGGVRLGYLYRSAVGGRRAGGFFALTAEGLESTRDGNQSRTGTLRLGTSWADQAGTWAPHLVGHYSRVDQGEKWEMTEFQAGIGIERTRWIGDWVRLRVQSEVTGRVSGDREGPEKNMNPGDALSAGMTVGLDFYHALERALTIRLHYRETMDRAGEQVRVPDGSGGEVMLQDPAQQTRMLGASIGYLF